MLTALRRTRAPERELTDYEVSIRERRRVLRALLRSDHALPDTHRKHVSGEVRRCGLVLQALDHGWEPTTPPTQWYGGYYRSLDEGDTLAAIAEERSPWKDASGTRFAYRDQFAGRKNVRVFSAPIPATIDHEARRAVKMFGATDVVVYSPSADDFETEVTALPVDPVIIAATSIGGRFHYFEVGRWDIQRDLAHAYELLAGD